MEFHHIVPHDVDADGDGARDGEDPQSPDPPIWSEVQCSLIISLFYVLQCTFIFTVNSLLGADYAFLF